MVPNPPAAGSATLTYRLDPADGHILANTPMVARWRLIAADDPTDVQLGPEVRITYLDDRFTWKTQTGGIVTVHWVEGSDAFGKRALKIAQDAIADGSALLGVTETEPVDFYIYADETSFHDALGPGARENVGGLGGRGHPDAVRAHPAEPDRRRVGRHRHPARADPSRVRHGVQEPVPLPAALAQ